MLRAQDTSSSSKATYFGESSAHDLKDLERNSARAKPHQLAKAASYLEQAFGNMKTAWFGGWALNLRGSRRETHDLDLLVLAESTSEVRSVLEQCSWALLSFHVITGSIQERFFVDIDEDGQVVGVDIVLSGAIGTPNLNEAESYESISHLSIRLKAIWPKLSILLDLQFLLDTYGDEIVKWSQYLDRNMRETFYDVYVAAVEDEERCKAAKKTLSL